MQLRCTIGEFDKRLKVIEPVRGNGSVFKSGVTDVAYNLDKYLQLADRTYFNRLGKVVKIVGLTIESVGPECKAERSVPHHHRSGTRTLSAMAEVVGFRDNRLLLMPL